MSEPIRVVLVDDHTLFRKGLAELLEQHGRHPRRRASPATATMRCAWCRKRNPMPRSSTCTCRRMDGLQLLRRLRAEALDGRGPGPDRER
ncbi:MAG: hypothetical protein MZW92_79035 [Comamonadaceae bacterium]|nr:hypothetical protein [Comamonadaceae bacterium]